MLITILLLDIRYTLSNYSHWSLTVFSLSSTKILTCARGPSARESVIERFTSILASNHRLYCVVLAGSYLPYNKGRSTSCCWKWDFSLRLQLTEPSAPGTFASFFHTFSVRHGPEWIRTWSKRKGEGMFFVDFKHKSMLTWKKERCCLVLCLFGDAGATPLMNHRTRYRCKSTARITVFVP